MDAQSFVANLRAIVSAPGGVDCVRQLILDLALAGSLSERGSDDPPVADLLDQLASGQERTAEAWSLRRQKGLLPVSVEERPHNIPPHWKWVRLGDVAYPQPGFAFKSNQFNDAGHGMPLIRIRDIGSRKTECFFDGEFRQEFVVEPGDYLVGMDGNFNIRRWQGGRALLNQRVARLIFFDAGVARPFIIWALQREINKLHGTRAYTTVQHLSGKQIASAPIPLPPRGEQERIVAKVDELMQLCDEFESRQHANDAASTRFRESALNALVEAETDATLGTVWNLVEDNWDTLADHPDSVSEMRRTILELAVRGKLVRQRSEEGDASALLGKMASRTLQAIKDIGIRMSASGARRGLDATSDVPQGWVLTPLGNACLVVMGNSPPGASYNKEGDGVPLINGPVEFASEPLGGTLVTQYTSKPTRMCDPGDLLVCVRGATTGRTNIASFTACIGRGVALVRAWEAQPYVNLFMWSVGQRLLDQGKGTTFPSISRANLLELPLPLPPLAEQERIVSRFNKLMRLCDDLETRLTNRRTLARRLAESATSHLVA